MTSEDFNIAGIGVKSFKSIVALMSRQFFINLISFGTSLVIFTVLTPAEVGIYTAVVAIQRIISFFTDFGFGAALVQKKEELDDADISTTFTLQLIVTAIAFVLTFIFLPPLLSFLNLGPEARFLLLALVFSMLASSFKVIPSIILERRIEFQKLIVPQVLESLVFNMILVVLVIRGHHLDSYAWAFLISSVISIPLYYMAAPWKIGLGISKSALLHLKFGLQFQAKNILATLKDDLLTVVLVKIVSLTELGYIGFAQRLSLFAYRYIVDSVTKVTFSAYSRMQEDKEALARGIEKSLFFVSSLMFPVIVAIIIAAPLAIRFIPSWNNKWEPAVLSLIFFSLNALVSSMSGILVNVLDASGKVRSTLNLMVMWTILTWVLTPLAVFLFGFNGVALASFIITLTIVVTVNMAKSVVNFRFLKSVYKPLIASLFMAGALVISTSVLAQNLILLIAMTILSGTLYMIILYLMAKDEINSDLAKILIKK